MFGVLLVYVSTLASAVGAVLPLVPVWLIALPAAAQLALQVPPCVLSCALCHLHSARPLSGSTGWTSDSTTPRDTQQIAATVKAARRT